MGAIISLLGGATFRMVFGEISAYLKHKQEMKAELAHMEAQGKLDAAAHSRNIESLRLQAELGIKTVQVQADADALRSDAEAFKEAMIRANAPTGIDWVDAWNGSVRPAFATVSLMLWLLSLHTHGWALIAWDMEMVGAVAGYYFADRTLRKQGK